MAVLHVIVLLISLYTFAYCNKFCNTYCRQSHVLCWREPCSRGDACGSEFISLPFTPEERVYVLNLHNELRQIISTGGATILQDNSSNICVLSYSKELEFISQCVVHNCYVHALDSACRFAEDSKTVGQNYFYMRDFKFSKTSQIQFIRKAVLEWFHFRTKLPIGIINNYIPVVSSVEDFLTLVFAKTIFIGCGKAYDSASGMLLLCNYAPSLTKSINIKILERGQPCTTCASCYEHNNCNEKYPALCGGQRSMDDDPFEPPFKMESFGTLLIAKSVVILFFPFVLLLLQC